MSDEPPQTCPETTPLFHRFGGHAHAVGFSLSTHRLADLRARISAHAALHLTSAVLTPTLTYDAELALTDITPDLHHWLQRLAPFGHGNPEPVFLLRSALLSSTPRVIKYRHICLELAIPNTTATLSALGWSRTSTIAPEQDRNAWPNRAARLNLAAGSAIDLLARLRHKTGAYANPHSAGLELELCDIRLHQPQKFAAIPHAEYRSENSGPPA